ncbi:MAG: 50S ribosomal protein L21, partial [Waddliaceae bacterium]
MYAIIKTGGKQYRVKKDDVIDVELLNGAEEGKNVEFGEVLFVKDGTEMKIGEPFLEGFAVVGE